MNVDTDSIESAGFPVFIEETKEILNWLKKKSREELKAIWKCNDKIAEQNFERLENMDLYSRLTPAIMAYEGIAFQYMAPAVFEETPCSIYRTTLGYCPDFMEYFVPLTV